MLWSLRWTMLNENPLFLDSTYRTNRYLGRSVSSGRKQWPRLNPVHRETINSAYVIAAPV